MAQLNFINRWTVLVFLLASSFINSTAYMMRFPGDYKCFNMTMGCEEDECKCACDKIEIPPTYEVTCPEENRAVQIRFMPRNYASIECSTINDEYRRFPYMALGEIEKVQLKGCKLPQSASLMRVFDRLGIKRVRSLFLLNDGKDFPNGLVKEHFKGFNDLTRLSITAPNLKSLPENVFDEIPNITWLDLKNMKIETVKADLEKLVNLETLEITGTNIARLEDGAFENLTNLQTLIIWNNKLETITKENFRGLRSLQVLELPSNRITSIEPDSFAYLENVERINLKLNRFTSLPEGLFSSNRHLREVTMVYNNIPTLPSRLFGNNPQLTSVDMSNSGIVSIPEDLFVNSTNIVNVTLSGNKILELPDAIFQGLVRLEKLELQSNALKSLGNNLLTNCPKIKLINLSYNDIENIPSGFFRFATDLIELYISNNRLTRIDSQTFENQINLQFVDMSNNRLEFESNLMEDANSELPNSPFHRQHNMESLILKNNSLKHINRDFTFVMVKLKTLDLSYNNISFVEYSNLQFSNGVELDLSNNQINEINFEIFEDVSASQSKPPRRPALVNIDNNPLNCNCGAHYFVQFLHNRYSVEAHKFIQISANNLKCNQPEELKDKLVKSVDIMDLTCDFKSHLEEKCPEKCKCSVRLADRALIVDCSSQNLESVPKLPVVSNLNFLFTILNIEDNRLNELPSLQNSNGYSEVRQIFARGNNISSIMDYQLPSNLTHLDISDNNLQSLDDSVIGKLNSTSSLQRISLSDNWWPCDCKMENLFLFMQANYDKISDYSSMMCVNGNYLSKITIGDVCPKDMQFIIILCVVLALFGIVIGLLTAIYFKYQQEIKIWMYWNNILPFIFNSDVLDTDKKYDAFISYSHKDEDFVADELIPELEQKRKFNLCIHRRDWMPGDFIQEQIIRSVSDSRRTIIVLSPHYMESVWGTMEFRAAHRSAMEEQVSRVIVIIYGQVDKSTLDPELKSYIDMNTYIEWGDPWFWERLHYALRNIKTKKSQESNLKSQNHIKNSVDDKLELIQPSPVTPPLTTPPAEGLPKNPLNGCIYNYDSPKPIALNGHINGAFIINTNSKQSDV